jgi:hypothetical protein
MPTIRWRRRWSIPGCPFSKTLWHEVLYWIRSTAHPLVVEADFVEWWVLVMRSTPRTMRKGTSSLIMIREWLIWKHRNETVFDNSSPSISSQLDFVRFPLELAFGLSYMLWCWSCLEFIHITFFSINASKRKCFLAYL